MVIINQIIPTHSQLASANHGFEKICPKKIQAALRTNSADLGIEPQFRQVRSRFDVHVFDSLPSTSTQLWKMMDSGCGGAGTVAIAQQQTAGRGQRGRVWRSEPGGLYLSLALEPDWPVAHSAQLTCMSAWGIATALNNLGIPIKIKWPNDLFFKDKKLGGILTETRVMRSDANFPAGSQTMNSPARIKQVVVGIGINWQNPVPDTGITLTEIMAQLPDCTAQNKINCLEMLTAVILKGILQGYLFQQQVGSQVFMKAYSNLLIQVGKVVSLDSNLLSLAVTDEHSDVSVHNLANRSAGRALNQSERKWLVDQFSNRSGEIIGVSEEGYLRVFIPHESEDDATISRVATFQRAGPGHQARPGPSPGCVTTNILLLKPSEICIS